MKKTLALVLALAMVFSTITVAFADEALSADTQACANLGMLKGETGTVDAAYAATVPNKIQAAVMLLRLKGLEEEAKAFTGEANFADADQVAWAKPIMAYLKANPQLGWVGDGTNFNPTQPVTAQMYYKVMLEALGYKQHTAEVIGDFTWENVIEFAASKGLTKVAAVTDFTINDLATATIEALKATVKEGGTTLAASLIEAGKIDAEVAKEAGIYTEVTTTEAALDSVFATANDKVEVGFDADVDKSFAENAANFKITLKGSDTALEIKSAELASDPSFVILTTAAQTGGAAYTLTVGAESKNFAGLAKSTAAPELDAVKCIDTNTVMVTFKKAVDRASAEDVANYTLDKNATVVKAELWASHDDSRKTVKLTTEGVANSKVYTLKVQNVKSADMTAMKSASKSFTGITDTKAPTIEGAVVVSNNQRILVNFDDPRGIDKASAENLANWSIKDSNGNELNIVSLKAVDDVSDEFDKYDQVEVATDTQNSGTKYTVTINNLSDDSVSKNVITKALTKTFTGKASDKSAPTVKECKALSDTAIFVQFNDQNRLDPETLTNISNYTFEKDITVTDAKILAPTKPDRLFGKAVLLTTTAMDEDIKSYKLAITGVADEFGNVMKTYNKSISYHKEDVSAPVVIATTWVDLNTVKIEFDETLDYDSAIDPANYVVNNDLGVVTKAETSSSDTNKYKTVTLTVPTMAENKKYTVTINGVKDLLGNATADAKAHFTSQRDGLDTTKPEIVSTEVVSEVELKVTFDEAVKFDQNGTTTLTAQHTTSTTTPYNATVTYDAVGYTLDDDTTIVFKADTTNNAAYVYTGDDDRDFRITSITNVTDKANNPFKADTDDYATFSGNSTENEPAEIDSIEQIDVRTIKVVFDKPVLLRDDVDIPDVDSDNGDNFDNDAFDTQMGINNDAYIDIDEEATNDALSTLTIKTSGPMNYDARFEFVFASEVVDYMGDPVVDLSNESTGKTTLVTTIDDEDGPVIEYVEAVHATKLQVHYNEELSYEGTYRLYEDGKTTAMTNMTLSASVDTDDPTIVNISLSRALTANDVYQIKPASAAKDLNNNKSDTTDVEFSFVGSTVATPRNYVKGITIIDSDTIRVFATCDLGSTGGTPTGITVKNKNGAVISEDPSTQALSGDSAKEKLRDLSYATVDLTESLVDGETYTVIARDKNGNALDSYTFKPDIDDGGISVDSSLIVTFSGVDAKSYVVKVVYDAVGNDGVVEDYLVLPVAISAVGFDLDANALQREGAPTTTITYASGITAGVDYLIEVYRTTADVVDADIASASAYDTAVAAKCETTPIYSQRITKPLP